MSKELKQRVTIAFLGIPTILAVFYTGGLLLNIFLALLSGLAMLEYIGLIRKAGYEIGWGWLTMAPVTYFGMNTFGTGFDLAVWFVIVFISFLFAMFFWKSGKSFNEAILRIFGLAYTSLLPALAFRINKIQQDKYLLLYLIILIWLADSSAYFIGMSFGKKRGLMKMSPNKSLAGFIAGILFPLIAVYCYIFIAKPTCDMNWLLLFAALSAGVAGQAGDMLESMLKRYAGVKNSSDILPGHGGILDRFDSFLIAAPVLYFLIIIFI